MTLLHHFFPPKPPPPSPLRLERHEDYTPLTSEEVSTALSKFSNTSAPGPDNMRYSVWKSVHRLKPSLLPSLLDHLLAHGLPPPFLKKALVIVLDKPGKPSYDSPSSFRVIVLLRTLSKILERVGTSRLSAQARTCTLIDPSSSGPSLGDPPPMPPSFYSTILNPFTASDTKSPPFSLRLREALIAWNPAPSSPSSEERESARTWSCGSGLSSETAPAA